jgi:hypothetical protein
MVCGTMSASAQNASDPISAARDRCRANPNRYERYCDVREFIVAAGTSLQIDGQANGDVVVHGTQGKDIRVIATVRTEALSLFDAQNIAHGVQVSAGDHQLHAFSDPIPLPASWSVSYEVWVPATFELTLTSLNGNLSVNGVNGKMELETTNGSVALTGVNGEVVARSLNGPVILTLEGEGWRGLGLTATTTNGDVSINVAPRFSARLVVSSLKRISSTVADVPNGTAEFLDVKLGRGGAPLKLATTNGAVVVRAP